MHFCLGVFIDVTVTILPDKTATFSLVIYDDEYDWLWLSDAF